MASLQSVISYCDSQKIDCFITGETIECYHRAQDAGLNVMFAGHHAAETVGVKLLARQVEIKSR